MSVEIGTVVCPVEKWDPRKSGDGTITYIDLSSVDRDTKVVSEPSVIEAADAPSRARQLVASGDVLVSTVRPNLNAVAVVPPELDGATASTGFSVLRAVEGKLDSTYLFHWAIAPAFVADMVRKATGASYPAVSDKIVKASRIPLPPIEEQRRIAAVLDAADELRAKRRHGLRLVRELENAMFAVFVESHASGETAMLGDVAERVTVGHVGPTSEHFTDDGVAFIRTGNIGDGTIIRDDLRYVTPSFHATLAKSTLREGDLLISRVISDEIRAAVVPPDLDGANCANAIIVRPGQRTSATFLLGLLRLARSQSSLLGRRVGSAQSVVNTKVVKEWHVPVPPRAALEALDHSYRRLRSLEARHLASLESITALFSSLQQRAFRGEL